MTWRDLTAWETRRDDLLREAEHQRLVREAKAAAQTPSLMGALKQRLMPVQPTRTQQGQTGRKPVVRVSEPVTDC